MKKAIILLLLTLTLCLLVYSYTVNDNRNIFIGDKYKNMTAEQLLDKADSFSRNNIKDSAFVYYSFIYNNRTYNQDIESKRVVCKALNKAAIICFVRCDYKLALELLFKALELCESIGYTDYIGRIYNNIGNVYNQFKDYNLAKRYYELAYSNGCDEGAVLSNLGLIAYDENKLDSALLLFNRSYLIKKESGDLNHNAMLNNIGMVYQRMRKSDSASLYYYKALDNARQLKNEERAAIALSNIGPLYFELKKYDSAVYYLRLSNEIASRIQLSNILASNYLTLSRIEEARGHIGSAFELYKKHSTIKDSLFNASEYVGINNMQFMYDMSKADQQIRDMNVEQEIKERTIDMQKKLQIVMGLILLTVMVFLVLLYRKNKNLNRAYTTLVSKNIEIVKSDQDNQKLKAEYEKQLKEKDRIIRKLEQDSPIISNVDSGSEDSSKYKHSALSEESKNKLVSDISAVMSNRDLICDPEFSLNQLADIVGSNYNYVSQTINESFNSNFRTFINDYRIKEALKILSNPTYQKYSIKSIAEMVGFKSRNTFDTIFKEVTGVTPSFYVRELKGRKC